MDHDYLIIGGGLVGAAIAYGISRSNHRILVLDEGDQAFRASRGNFGLVWVQGKGADHAAYAQWSGYAADLWPDFNQSLCHESGVDIDYHRPGGMEFCLNEEDWQARSDEMANVHRHTDGKFQYQMLDHDALKKRIPQIGPEVVGASFSPQDGHVNPLFLLRALHQQMMSNGVSYQSGSHIDRLDFRGGEFIAHCTNTSFTAEKIVLCAGLDNQRLGNMLNISVPVEAVRGQILISERVQPFLNYPTLNVRQTREGGLQIGDSHEHVGFDDGTYGKVIAHIAQRAVRMFPHLENLQLVRAWGALRIMTPDGYPVYQQSIKLPGAYAISTHSGVSLAAAHAGPVADWIQGKQGHPLIQYFGSERFDVAVA